MHALPSLSLRTVLTGGIGIEITCTRDTRHAHTHHHDTTGPEGGDRMLVLIADPPLPTVASPPSNG